MEEQPKRILHIVSAMNRGGAETLIMNIYRHLDKSKVQFDFISHRTNRGHYDDEIEEMGGKIYYIPSLGRSGPVKYINTLKKLMSENQYIAVHSHTDYQGGLPALAAKLTGVKKRIVHSHSNNWPQENGLKQKIILTIFKSLIHFCGTTYCACSQEAARFLFGETKVENQKVNILNNGIEVKTVSNNSLYEQDLRKELYISETAIIIGHVGTFSTSKNQTFILNTIKGMLEDGEEVAGVFVGDGPLKRDVQMKAEQIGIQKFVRFLGVREDIPRLMKAFDVFVFPSIFEGFGMVLLEAQCAGTPCVVSDTIPKTTDLRLGLISFLSLQEELVSWMKEIKKASSIIPPEPETIHHRINQYGFNIKNNVPQWLELYGLLS